MKLTTPKCPVCDKDPIGTVDTIVARFDEYGEGDREEMGLEEDEFDYSNDTDLETQRATINSAGEILLTCEDGHEWFSGTNEAPVPSEKKGILISAQDLVDLAKQHGEDSEADCEVGDLQELFLAAVSVMSETQLQTLIKTPRFEAVLEGMCVNGIGNLTLIAD